MMKSFFKKLAVVLAMAMVVSLAAPAATASAAEAKEFTYKYQNGLGTAVKTVNLAKTGDTVDLKFVGISDYKNYELQWMSYGNGFELDQNGVLTATADEGEGTIWLSVGDDQTYVSDPIKVTIGQLTATIGTQDKSNKNLDGATLKVGEKMDLAFYGITDWNLGKYGYKWVIADTSVLDVDQKTGEITALKAGETTVTFLAPNKFNQSNIVVTNALKVTVLPDVEPAIEAVQKTQNNFEILFTDLVAANFTDNDVEVVCVFDASKDTNGNGVIDSNEDEGADAFFIKPVTVDKDNNKMVVDTYADFVDGNVYEVTVGKYTYRFTASVGKVATVVLTAKDGLIPSNSVGAKPATLSVKLYDAKNIDVTTVEVDGIKNIDRVTYEIAGGDTATYYLVGSEVTFIEPGSVVAQAFYDYYNLDGRCDSNKVTVRGTMHDDFVAKVVAWAVVNENDANDKINWNSLPELWVAAGDENRHIVALLVDSRDNYFTTHTQGTTAYTGKKYKDAAGKEHTVLAMDYVPTTVGDSFVFAANGYYVEFASQNNDNFMMYADGEVVTYKAVTSSLKLNLLNIYNNEVKPLATVPFTVKPERVITTLSTSSTSVTGVTDTMYDAFDGDDTAHLTTTVDAFKKFTRPSIKLTIKDQYNAKWFRGADCDEYEVDFVAAANGSFTDAEKYALEVYAEELEALLNGAPASENTVEFNTKYIRDLLTDDDTNNNNRSNRNSVSFKFTDKNSGRFVTVQVKLEVPNYETEYDESTEIKVDTKTITGTNRENVTILVDKLEVDKTIDERASWNWNWSVLGWDKEAGINLYTTSKGYEVGYSQDLMFVAKTIASGLRANVTANGYSYDDGTGEREIKVGDKILVVVGPDNKAVPVNALGAIDVTTGATSAALGVKIITNSVDADANAGKPSANYYTYALEVAGDANNDTIMEYLRTGRYTVQVRTVAGFGTTVTNGTVAINLATASSVDTASSLAITVTNTNGKIALAGQVTRDLRETADYIEEVVADAFDFNYVDADSNFNWLGSLDWNRDTLESLIAGVDYRVGNGYVYIKSVTFKVPVEPDGKLTNVNKFFYCTVPVGSSVQVSNDIFFYDNNAGNN